VPGEGNAETQRRRDPEERFTIEPIPNFSSAAWRLGVSSPLEHVLQIQTFWNTPADRIQPSLSSDPISASLRLCVQLLWNTPFWNTPYPYPDLFV